MNYMNIQQKVSLAQYSTMGLGGEAAYLTEISDRQELPEVLAWAQSQSLPVRMIGGGSNTVWGDAGFPGLVIINKIPGYEVFDDDGTNVYLKIGSGEDWDSVVARSVEAGLTGIEALSLIPGTAGATPIQNVGAYGQEISQTLTTVEAFDNQLGNFVLIAGPDCGFSYRSSRFKTTDSGRFYIVSLTLHLRRANPEPPFYGAVQTFFEGSNITAYTPAALREAVLTIRRAKLPDPAVVRNCGSFFANPIIPETQFIDLASTYQMIPHWEAGPETIKISAAWLIEQVGYKDFHDPETGMSTWPTQPLVLVNEKAQSTADLLKFRDKIITAVQQKFNITLQQEPELL
jgi:UDP-N-acetylmuramate dehydrogenase